MSIKAQVQAVIDGILAGKILETSASGSLGIVNPDSFKLAINTDTAKKLGLKLERVQENSKTTFYP